MVVGLGLGPRLAHGAQQHSLQERAGGLAHSSLSGGWVSVPGRNSFARACGVQQHHGQDSQAFL